MNPTDLLRHCRRAGIRLSAGGNDILYDAPAGAMTPQLRALLREHKPRILKILKEQNQPRLLTVEQGLIWEQQHIARARRMIAATTSDPQLADDLYRSFSGAWSVALCDGGASEQQAVERAFAVLRRELARLSAASADASALRLDRSTPPGAGTGAQRAGCEAVESEKMRGSGA